MPLKYIIWAGHWNIFYTKQVPRFFGKRGKGWTWETGLFIKKEYKSFVCLPFSCLFSIHQFHNWLHPKIEWERSYITNVHCMGICIKVSPWKGWQKAIQEYDQRILCRYVINNFRIGLTHFCDRDKACEKYCSRKEDFIEVPVWFVAMDEFWGFERFERCFNTGCNQREILNPHVNGWMRIRNHSILNEFYLCPSLQIKMTNG